MKWDYYCNEKNYINGLYAAPYITIIHFPALSQIFKEEVKAQFALTKHHIAGTKQGNSWKQVGLQFTNYLGNQREHNKGKLYMSTLT